MIIVFQVMFYFFIFYLSASIIWPFVLSFVSHFIQEVNENIWCNETENSILILIPAYKEDDVIIETARNAMQHNYNRDLYKVVVLADGLKVSTLDSLKNIGIEVFEIRLDKSTKARAINQAMSYYGKPDFDIVVVLDADNHMKNDFLAIMNRYYNLGFKAIQGRRSAKNYHTSVSILDGISEEINNHILCKGQYLIGGSSRLSGSGMAFDIDVFKSAMAKVDVVNGFDKNLELELVRNNIRICYAEDAVILDEKVSKSEVFQKQRTRWLAAQYFCFVSNIGDAFKVLLTDRNWSFFQKVISFAIPPKLLLPFVLILTFGFSLLLFGFGVISFWILFLSLLFVTTYLIAIPEQYWSRQSLVHLRKIPQAMLLTLMALSRMSSAKNKFIHTPHSNSSSLKSNQ